MRIVSNESGVQGSSIAPQVLPRLLQLPALRHAEVSCSLGAVKRILNNQQRSNESYKRMCRQLQEVGIPAVAPGSPIMKPGCILGAGGAAGGAPH